MASLKDLVNRVKQYFDPTSNGGNNFWGNSPVAQGLGSFQKGIENFSNKPQFQIAPQIKNPVFRFAAGLPEGIINSPQNSIAGANQLGTNYRQGTLTPQNTLSSFARMADLPLNIATFGGAGAVADQIGKQSLKNVLLNAGKSGIKYGAGFGALGGLQDLNNQDTFLSGAGKVAMGAGTGAVVGAGLGVGLAGAGYGINKFADSKVAEFVGNKLSQKTKISKMDSATAKNLVMTKVAEAGIPVTAGDTPDGMINLLAKRDWQSTNNPALQDAIKLSRFVKATQEGMVVNAPPIGLTTKDISRDIKVNLKKNLAKDVQGKLYDASYRSPHQIIGDTKPASDLTNLDQIISQHKINNGYLTKYDLADLKKLRDIQGKPDAEIKIYRASPVNELNNGDWITTSKTYANDIKKQNGGKVYEYTVKASDLKYPNDITELPSLARFSAFKYEPNSPPKNQMLEDFLSGKINDTVQNRPIASKVDAQAGLYDVPLYRASNKPFDANLMKTSGQWPGTHFATTEDFANSFSLNGKRNVQQMFLDKNAKVLNFNDIPEEISKPKNLQDFPNVSARIYKYAKEKGYDAVYSMQPTANHPNGQEVTVINPSVLKDKPSALNITQPNSKLSQSSIGLNKEGKLLSPQEPGIQSNFVQQGEKDLQNVSTNPLLNNSTSTRNINVAQQPLSVTQNNMTPVGDILASKPQIEVPKTSIVGQTNAQPIIPPKNVTPQEVAAQLPNKVENFVNKVLGYSTETPMGGTKQASGYTKLLRSGQEAITRKVEQGMGSENSLVRNAATTLQNFFRGLGMSPERANASMELRGGMSTANERAFNVMDSLYKSIDHNKGSLERINAVLDPALSKVKVAFKDLTPQEKQVYGIIREGLDLVHDTSYANGAISKELYLKNQGKYTPRMYDVMELPPEVNKFVTQGKKIVTDLYKSRKELDQWKVENNLNDPVYALGKRLAQVDTNSAIKKYTDFLASNPRFVSDMERPGFTKLSDSPAYGSLSGKYVLNSAAEDLKGFFFANEGMQNLYDVFRAYDRLPIRQLQKKLLTVFNPTTNVGNIVSDQVFGFVTGVDPLTLNKNLIKLKTNPSEFKSLSDYLMRKGITATDITRTDFVNKLGQIDDLASGKKSNMIKILSDKVQSFYGGTDDVYKVSAFKSLLDRGFTTEEAARKVADGFQNYANVGKFYDVWAKTPVVGSAFIKFQGDLMRIIKNGAVNNPLGLITFLGSLYGVAKLSSKLSGETPEDYKTRTERFAAPMIPGLNIPLTWQTPWGEINAARYISPFYANNETTNIAKMLPFVPNIQPNKDVASNIAMNANDPLLAPFVQLAVNRDFRGKPISDPKENKYQPSTLTPQEKLTNQAVFAGRAYLPPPVNSAIDVSSAIQGKPNMYGTPQTTGQAVARLGGIKISNMNSTEVQKIRDNEAQYQQYANDAIDKQISSVTKGLLQNNVTPEQAMKRIEYLSKQKSNITQTGVQKINDKVVKVGNEYKYLDEKGNQQTIADFAIPEAPKLTGNTELDKKLVSKYKGKLTAEANDVVKRWELGIIDQGEAEKQLKQIKAIQNSGKKPKKISVKIASPKMVKISKSKSFKPSRSLVNKTPVYKISKARKPKNISIAVGKSKIPAYKIKKFTNTLAGGGTRLA